MGAKIDGSEAFEPPIRARPVNSSRAILALNEVSKNVHYLLLSNISKR